MIGIHKSSEEKKPSPFTDRRAHGKESKEGGQRDQKRKKRIMTSQCFIYHEKRRNL